MLPSIYRLHRGQLSGVTRQQLIFMTQNDCILRASGLAALLFATPYSVANPAEARARELQSADCVAALEVKSDKMAKKVRGGQSELRPLLIATLDAGAAFIGHAYLQGERDEAHAQALKDAAMQAQKALSEDALAELQGRCEQEGTRLLAQSDLIGRAVVSMLVQRRLHKLLGD